MMEECMNGKILKEENDSWQSDDDEEYFPDSDSDDEEESVSSVKGVRIKTEPVSEEEYEDSLEKETSPAAIQKRHSEHELEGVIQSHRPKKVRPNPQEEKEYIWTKSFSGRDIQPFVGQQRVCSKELGQRSTPLDCFSFFFDSEVIRFIIDMTNLNAVRKIQGEETASFLKTQSSKDPDFSIKVETVSNDASEKSWKFVDVDEMKAFLGLIILMGIIRLPHVAMYWQKKNWILDVPSFNMIMPRDRFQTIQEHLHFCDESLVPAEEDNEKDRFFKIHELLSLLLPRFQTCYTPGRDLHIYENLIPIKGKSGFKKYMDHKKYGIKLWLLTESSTGYVSRLQFYSGKNQAMNPESGLSLRVIKYLVSPFEWLHHHLYVDNFFASPKVFEYLLSKGTYACGTFNSDSVGFPKDLIMEQTCKMGESDWRATGNLLAQSWMDNKAFYYLSTIHEPDYDVGHSGKTITKRRRDHTIYGTVETPCPPLVREYNMQTGHLCVSNQVRKYGNIARRSKVWYRKVFSYLIEVAINNARVVYEKVTGESYYDLEFREKLMTALIGNHRAPRNTPTTVSISLARLQDAGIHHPVSTVELRVCSVCSKIDQLAPVNRKSTTVPRTTVRCSECNVHLCVRNGRTCFRDWHTKVEYWKAN
uniref:piggyBac transposable element-derived protein 4-like isoform X1 n=1 Tax=Styela clava TaxID=7725 RepID=UPI00193A629D|nr:piggyBac transposable element-derived protein 4-like isoform X1 [Styela clava]XP_039255704.1 piggyBac transposable element-derived protein 4-like isoform X1 [Styela clava]XP_039255705.1 piggyBac transposable element-derived protein 4-like isoform X1 [Styela clava]XP_039255706.1 piggyBac transposable element-derived protein 4-like isoform X1 [Styela clava]XP_039255707.1 piggyBac transposable element-derived protein 4-like isoform X1 [Styela clava]